MATTVGQHSVAAFTSPVNGTTPIDANTVRGNDNTVRSAYVDHDADPGIHVQSSSLASRPAAGTAGRKWITEDSGVYTLWFDDGTNWHPVSSENVALTVLAGENLVKGDVVKVTGWNNGQDLPEVVKTTSASDTAFAVITATVSSGSMGYATNTGIVQDVNTAAYSVGTILYANGSGGFTSTKPTSGNYQPVAYVLRANASNGVYYVEFSTPRIVERSDNTASTIVLRDASGNFSAGTITAGALTSTGLVTFASLKGTGATTVTNILDEDNMASDSATALATQQSIKAYVDAKVATVDTLAEVLANGNTTGANNIIVSSGQKITTNTIDETTAAAGVTIDSVLLKDDVVNATDIEVDTISANNGTLAVTLGSTGVATIAQQPILSSLTASQAVFTDASKGLVSNAITGTGNVVMSASPTLTGTVTAATINATTLGGTLSTAAQPNVTSLGTLSSLAVTGNLTLGADVVLSRGAADRLDLASGDSLNVVSGTYKIAGTDVLSSNTLGSGVTASSLTSVGTLTSLTVSGNANLATSSGSVGVGNTNPGTKLEVSGDVTIRNDAGLLYFRNSAASAYPAYIKATASTDLIIATNQNIPMKFRTNDTERMSLDASGNLAVDTNTLYVDAANNRVGVGTASPGVLFDVAGPAATGTKMVRLSGTTTGFGLLSVENTGGQTFLGVEGSVGGGLATGSTAYASIIMSNTNTPLQFGSFNTIRATLDASGNLGLGVTPSAWGADYKALQFGGGSVNSYTTLTMEMYQNVYDSGAGAFKYNANGLASRYQQGAGEHRFFTAPNNTSGAGASATFTQAMTLDASGNLGIANTSPGSYDTDFRNLVVGTSGATGISIISGTSSYGTLAFGDGTGAANYRGYIQYNHTNDYLALATAATERARITSGGDVYIGKTSRNLTTAGWDIELAGDSHITALDNVLVAFNRQNTDGTLIEFAQAGTVEGNISVSGNTVSYNAFAGSHWSQLEDGSKPEILRGTVMEALNELCEWPGEQNERLPKAKVSDTAGSKKVYGVFMDWDNDWTETNDMYVTSLGAFVCRVAADVVVEQGDLLESNGDGTARVQADDVIRSSTIGKVTSTVKTHEYEDGTYCVPTVLYCG